MSQGRQKKKDKDMESVSVALVRAGQRARKIAAQTGTKIVVVRDGQMVEEVPIIVEEQKSDAPGEDGG